MSTGGGYAEYIVLDEYYLGKPHYFTFKHQPAIPSQRTATPSNIAVAKPRNLSHVLATAVLSPGLTAHTAITHILRCQPGESILILDGVSVSCSLSYLVIVFGCT